MGYFQLVPPVRYFKRKFVLIEYKSIVATLFNILAKKALCEVSSLLQDWSIRRIGGGLSIDRLMVLCAMVGMMDKENVDLTNMFGASILVSSGLALLLTIGIGILTCEYIFDAQLLATVEIPF